MPVSPEERRVVGNKVERVEGRELVGDAVGDGVSKLR